MRELFFYIYLDLQIYNPKASKWHYTKFTQPFKKRKKIFRIFKLTLISNFLKQHVNINGGKKKHLMNNNEFLTSQSQHFKKVILCKVCLHIYYITL